MLQAINEYILTVYGFKSRWVGQSVIGGCSDRARKGLENERSEYPRNCLSIISGYNYNLRVVLGPPGASEVVDSADLWSVADSQKNEIASLRSHV